MERFFDFEELEHLRSIRIYGFKEFMETLWVLDTHCTR